MERTESVLEYFLRSARSLGFSKGELVGRGFVAHWQGRKEDNKTVDPLDGKVYDDFKDAPAVSLYYPSVERTVEEHKYHQLGLQLNGRFEPKLIHVPGSTKPCDGQTAAAKDPFALVAQGKVSPESYYWNFWRTGYEAMSRIKPAIAGDEPYQKVRAHFIAVKIQNGVVVEVAGKDSLEETARNIRSLIADQIPLSYKPVVDWMLAAYKGLGIPKLDYEQLVSK